MRVNQGGIGTGSSQAHTPMTTLRDMRIHIIVLHRQTRLIRGLNLVPTRGLGITRLIPVTRTVI